MKIKILGTGCPKCKTLEKITLGTVQKMKLDAQVTKEEDIVNIMNYGVLNTPALVINEKVVISGRIPSEKELTELLTQNQ
jgi:small redox-active disulfide protein 2